MPFCCARVGAPRKSADDDPSRARRGLVGASRAGAVHRWRGWLEEVETTWLSLIETSRHQTTDGDGPRERAEELGQATTRAVAKSEVERKDGGGGAESGETTTGRDRVAAAVEKSPHRVASAHCLARAVPYVKSLMLVQTLRTRFSIGDDDDRR